MAVREGDCLAVLFELDGWRTFLILCTDAALKSADVLTHDSSILTLGISLTPLPAEIKRTLGGLDIGFSVVHIASRCGMNMRDFHHVVKLDVSKSLLHTKAEVPLALDKRLMSFGEFLCSVLPLHCNILQRPRYLSQSSPHLAGTRYPRSNRYTSHAAPILDPYTTPLVPRSRAFALDCAFPVSYRSTGSSGTAKPRFSIALSMASFRAVELYRFLSLPAGVTGNQLLS